MTLFKFRTLVSTTLCLLSHTIFALTVNPVNGWYAGLLLGGSYPLTVNFNGINPLTGVPITSSLGYSLGGDFGGQLGYRCDPFRFEVEALYNYNAFNKLQTGNVTLTRKDVFIGGIRSRVGGNTQVAAGILNGYYDFTQMDNDINIAPYLGLGLGFAYTTNKLQLLTNDITTFDASQSHSSLFGQAIIGAQYFVDDATSLGLDYRFMAMTGFGLPNNLFRADNTNLMINTLNLTLNFSFEPDLSGV